MFSVPPWKKFFWPGLNILRAGGLASSAGSLFQCFTSLTDKKVFLVCNSLHGWNRKAETAWEDRFSDTSWVFIQQGFHPSEMDELLRVRAKWSEFLSCPSSIYPWSPHLLHDLCDRHYTECESEHRGQSSFQPLSSPHHLQHAPYEEYMTKASAHWHCPQGIISFSINLYYSEQGFGLVGFCHWCIFLPLI